MTPATANAQWSLRHELTRVLVIAALLPALVFGVALLWNQRQGDQDDLRMRLGANAQLSASAIDDFLHGQLSGCRCWPTVAWMPMRLPMCSSVDC
jgi:hypothetical protein